MNQTEAMVMEKKGSGLTSTLTNAAVSAKSSSMASRLPRIRTASGMLHGRAGHQLAAGAAGRGRGSEDRAREGFLAQGAGLTTGTGRS